MHQQPKGARLTTHEESGQTDPEADISKLPRSQHGKAPIRSASKGPKLSSSSLPSKMEKINGIIKNIETLLDELEGLFLVNVVKHPSEVNSFQKSCS
jgi:hypothetical protein